jgi:hypothetical protein
MSPTTPAFTKADVAEVFDLTRDLAVERLLADDFDSTNSVDKLVMEAFGYVHAALGLRLHDEQVAQERPVPPPRRDAHLGEPLAPPLLHLRLVTLTAASRSSASRPLSAPSPATPRRSTAAGRVCRFRRSLERGPRQLRSR